MSTRIPESRSAPPQGPSIISDYRLLPGVPDEMIDPGGALRPGWDRLMSAFDALGPTELASRFERADQYLRDAGVFYRKYDGAEGKERAWPLAHIPLLIDETPWQTISRGLTQRAELMENIVADIYGDNRLVQEGLLTSAVRSADGESRRVFSLSALGRDVAAAEAARLSDQVVAARSLRLFKRSGA